MGDMGTRNANCRNADLRHRRTRIERHVGIYTFQEMFSLSLPFHHSNCFLRVIILLVHLVWNWYGVLENSHFLFCMPMSLKSHTRDRELEYQK